MGIPNAPLTVRDGALGLVAPDGKNTIALVGSCSSGTANVPAAFTDIQNLKDTLGTGPMVELAAFILSIAGGAVICCKATTSNGTNGSVTKVGSGSSVMTFSGTPLDSYQGIALIVTGGANPASGVVTFKVSLDGGRTYSAELALSTGGTYAVPGTGLTLNFSAASLVAGDTYSWTSVGPSYDTSALNTAVQALLDDATLEFFHVHAVGVPADGTAGAALFGALSTKMTTAESSYRYIFGSMAAEDDTRANVKANYVALTSSRMAVGYGFANITSALSGAQYKRPAIWEALARAAKVTPKEDLGRVRTGPVSGAKALIHNEDINTEMDAAGFTTLRTIVGLRGFFITNGRIKSAVGSDFRYWQHRRVMDLASAEVRAAGLQYLNEDVIVDPDTGLILETSAAAIETYIEERLRAKVRDYTSDVQVTVDRTVNILSTEEVKLKYRIVPLGYTKSIRGEIGFSNPALQLAA